MSGDVSGIIQCSTRVLTVTCIVFVSGRIQSSVEYLPCHVLCLVLCRVQYNVVP